MKLYYSQGSCSLAIRIIINEIGIDCEFESVDFKTKKTKSGKDYLLINPKGSVPALELNDGQILTENAVIQQYLADTHQAAGLLPSIGNFERYKVLEWLNFISTDIHKSCGPLFNPQVPEDIKNTVFKPLLKTKLAFIDKTLSDKKFLLGNEFTLPDAYLFVILSWAANLKVDIDDLTHIKQYQHELSSRSSIEKSFAAEKLA